MKSKDLNYMLEEKLLSCYLRLDVHVAAMKTIIDDKTDENIGVVPDNKMSYCQMIAKATKGGLYKVEDRDFGCDTSARMLGLRAYYEEQEDIDGWYNNGFYDNREIATQQKESVRPISNRHKGLVFGGLGAFHYEPDVIMVLCNAYQAMRLVQGYTYSFGYKKNYELSGMCGVCFESSALPINKETLNMSLLCSGSRAKAGWSDDLMMLSFPYHMTEKIINGLMQTANKAEPDDYKLEIVSRLKKQGLKPETSLENGMAYFYKD